MDAYKLFGMPQHFSTERWERLKVELEQRPEMEIEVIGPMGCQPGTVAYEGLVNMLENEIQQRLVNEMGRRFSVTSTRPVAHGHAFRIMRL